MTHSTVRRAIAALVAVAAVVLSPLPLAAAGPMRPSVRPPIVLAAPSEAPAYGAFTLDVAVPASTASVRRTAVLWASRDGAAFERLMTWPVKGAGRRSVRVGTGTTTGRVWLKVVVSGKGLRPQTRTVSVRLTNPYRPSAPDNVDVPEAGVAVTGLLFGSHPIIGVPEGSGTVRLWDTSTAWNQIEPAQGQFAWYALDRAVASAEANNQQVLLVLGGTPAWAASGEAPGTEFAGKGSSMPPRDGALFEGYVRAVVARYGGRIQAYQVWNEGNIDSFWRGSAEAMADLTARAYRVIKAAQPGATVVATSTGSRWVKGFTDFYPDYLAALGRLGWPIDAYSVHLYPLASGGPRDRAFLLGMMRTALRIAQAPDRPIWETEINYGITNPGGGETARTIPPADVPGYVSRTYLDSLRYGIARTYWYAWTPEYRLLGIQMWVGYPASRAYRATSDWLIGSTFSGCATTGVVVQCNFDRAGVPFFVAYTDDGSAATLPTPSGTTVVTSLDGATTPAGAQTTVGGTPVRIS